MSLTQAQVQAIDITEKVGSVLSVIGEAFVISTFLLSSKFRKPVNRLVFYATWGNILASVATLIGRTGIGIGLESPLCQFQAFLIQWFMPADALWTFALACNVWLSFFYHYDAPKLRSLEWKYLLFCYGLPFPPALAFLFMTTKNMGRVYGDASLWCWISIQWDFLRVAIFYAPIWVVMLLTMAVYIRVGIVIYKWRRQLRSLGRQSNQDRHYDRVEMNTPVNGIRRTDEVVVAREVSFDHIPYSPFRGLQPTRTLNLEASQSSRHRGEQAFTFATCAGSRGSKGTFRSASNHANRATVKYCKCALLFFIALLVTWVPSSINRIYTLFNPESVIFALQFAAALVLPLQGFWNAVVYVATSVFACKCLWQDILKTCGICKPAMEAIPIRREVRALSLDSRGERRAESDTTSPKTNEAHWNGVRATRRVQSFETRT